MTAARKSTAVALLCTAVLFSPALFTVADAAAQQGAQTVEITFIKWLTRNTDGTFGPQMEGTVGGALGNGTYAGEILANLVSARFAMSRLEAIYHVEAGGHAISAVIQGGTSRATGYGKLEGHIIAGTAGVGSPVRVEFQTGPCSQAPNGTCFRGTMRVDLIPN